MMRKLHAPRILLLFCFLTTLIGTYGGRTRRLVSEEDEYMVESAQDDSSNSSSAAAFATRSVSMYEQTKIEPKVRSKKGNVFRQYIGAINDVSFSDVPINPGVEFHFILSFAIDYTSDGGHPTNGKFGIFWNNNLDPSSVKAIKAKHPNVKVMLSLGGDSVGDDTKVQFNPDGVSSWVSNAVSSLTKIIQTYHLDGIDIDYEHFDSSNRNDFASCIGQLIRKLKNNGVIKVASIAPWSDIDHFYLALWAKHRDVIDFVNYQFFTTDPGTSIGDYVGMYHDVVRNYKGGTVLASFCTEHNVGVSPATAINAAKKLKASGMLPGMYIFSADDSYASDVGFKFEKQAQALLAK